VHAVGGLVGEPYRRVCETGRGQVLEVFVARECTGDAANVRAALGPVDRSEVIFGNHIADPDSATRHKHSIHLTDHFRLVSGQVDHAIAASQSVPRHIFAEVYGASGVEETISKITDQAPEEMTA
jgi:hypothetical protein